MDTKKENYESLSALANNRTAIKSNELEMGAVIEGYLVKVTEKPNRNPKFKQPNVSIFLTTEEGEQSVVFAAGNLAHIKKQLEDAKIEPGTKVRFTKVAPPEETNYKNYFDIRVNREDKIDLNSIAGQEEY